MKSAKARLVAVFAAFGGVLVFWRRKRSSAAQAPEHDDKL